MSVDFIPAEWAFVIDTHQYAGNFERELCAWVTGQTGDCGVGDGHAEAAHETMPAGLRKWCEENVAQVADEHGCARPVSIWPTPGFFNDGFGNEWPEGANSAAVRKKWMKELQESHDSDVKRCKIGIAAGKEVAEWERELESHSEEFKRNIERGPGHYPAYMSAAIFLHRRPSDDVVAALAERSRNYSPKLHRLDKFGTGKFKVSGFRLLRLELKETVVWTA